MSNIAAFVILAIIIGGPWLIGMIQLVTWTLRGAAG